MSITERPAPPTGARLDQAVADFASAMDSMAAGLSGAREAVGRNRPMTSGQQALVMGAAGRLVGSMADYQLAVLGIEPEPAAGAVVVPLGIFAEEPQPPFGCDLRTEYVQADQLVCGDRAVEASKQVVGPRKRPWHFPRIEATSGMVKGDVVLGWGGEEHRVPFDTGFVRVTTGRLMGEDAEGEECAAYAWEVAGR